MSLEPVDAETAVVAYLGPLLGVHVGTKVPNPAPNSFVRVTRVGGARHDLIEERPTMLFECWAPGAGAMTLAARCWRYVNDAEGTFAAPGVWCNGSNPSSPINFPDPNYDTRDRYQFYAPMVFALKEMT